MTMTTEDVVRKWWTTDVQSDQSYKEMSVQNRYNVCNMLAGFLQACEKLELLTHKQAQDLFTELVE